MQSQRKFRIIASKTMGEHSSKDVEGDAIFVALELRERHGVEIDFDKPEFRSVLVQHLYQRIVRWTDTRADGGELNSALLVTRNMAFEIQQAVALMSDVEVAHVQIA